MKSIQRLSAAADKSGASPAYLLKAKASFGAGSGQSDCPNSGKSKALLCKSCANEKRATVFYYDNPLIFSVGAEGFEPPTTPRCKIGVL